ncbi:carbohydrate ABC transporter permease [Sinomonas sp.]|jgi:multiple sugar transport system permease protein|uniref:carbohydrate ABC transporter permease n=1 Tax=Sinomonas sp. TaxID=1914986 RepID=UPI002FE07031
MTALTTRTKSLGAASGPEGVRARNRKRAARREGVFGWLMIALSAASILVFTALPIVFTFVLSFFSWDIISPPEFVGLRNFTRLGADQSVIHSFGVTALLAALIVVLQIVVGLAMALLVQQRKSVWARSIFRTAFFLPLLVSAASISIVFSYLFDDHFGVINYYLQLLHLPAVQWLSSSGGATATIVIVAVWQQLGFVFILFVAALGSLPKDVLEAVSLDGSGPIRTFFSIKLPLISPTIFFAAVIGLINAMQIFDQPYVMTKGGPGDATTTTVMLIYRTAFQNIQFGYGSAISVVLFVLLLVLTGLQFLISRKWVFYS